MHKIILIACSKNKADHTCPAREMYAKSALFVKARTYVEANHPRERWYILSALHGLLAPSKIIEPYNVTLNDMKDAEIKKWSIGVWHDIEQIQGLTHVDVYAGEKYRRYLVPWMEGAGIQVSIPLQGMGIGQQLGFYTAANKKAP